MTKRLETAAILLGLCAAWPAPASAQTPAPPIQPPPGYQVDVHAFVPFPLSLRRIDGDLWIGGHNGIWIGEQKIVSGTFLAASIDRAVDGTVYVADTFQNPWPYSNLWKFTPNQTLAATAFIYCQGVVALPDGGVLATDTGWLGGAQADGRVVRLTGSTNSTQLPLEIITPLRNPVSPELGPDGYVYLVDRGQFDVEPGWILRFLPGNPQAEIVLTGLNDPWDTAWAPDGTMFISDEKKLMRWTPATGVLETFATGFGDATGVDVAPNGDIFVGDPTYGVVWKLSVPLAEVALALSPETLNVKSQGKWVQAEFGEAVAAAAVVAVDGAKVAPIAVDGDGRIDRQALVQVLEDGFRLIRVEGTLPDGTRFKAEDTIRVIGGAKKN